MDEDKRMKYRAAERLGLMEKLTRVGWAGLSAQETGRIGGLVGARIRQRRKEQECTQSLPGSTTD